MYFALMGVLKFIPLAVFAAILISVAINMSRFPLFAKLSKFGVRDSIILFTTFALTVIFDLTVGVLCGLAITMLLNVKNFKIGVSVEVSQAESQSTIIAKGTLFFLNANKVVDVAEKALVDTQTVIIDLSNVQRVDETAMEKLKGLEQKAKIAGKSVEYVGANESTQHRFNRFGHLFGSGH